MPLRTLHASVEVLDLDEMAERPITRLEDVKTFLSDSLLEKLAAVANRGLCLRGKRPTTSHEIIGLIVLHVLCASYNESPTTVCDSEEFAHFLNI